MTHHAEMLPVFVVGVGRSGTSLVQSMLSAHPEALQLPETGMLRRLIIPGTISKALRRGDLPALAARLHADARLSFLGLDWRQLLVELGAQPPSQQLDLAFYQMVLQRLRQSTEPRFFVDKDPRLIESLDWLAAHFPAAHIVHVIRDPRDVLASKLKAEWSKRRPWWWHVFANRVQFKMGRSSRGLLREGHYHELIYERLIQSPEVELRRICDALSLTFDERMLQFTTVAEKLVRPDERSWKKETLGPILAGNSRKWTELSGWQIAITEAACRDVISYVPYDTADGVPRPRWYHTALSRPAAALFACAELAYRAAVGVRALVTRVQAPS